MLPNNIHDVDTLEEKYKKNGLTHIKLFREQANTMKKNSPNPSAIVEIEESVKKIEKYFMQEQP